jgi:glutamate/tyrosine decarboxylase-like PLP-dependent enzyme
VTASDEAAAAEVTTAPFARALARVTALYLEHGRTAAARPVRPLRLAELRRDFCEPALPERGAGLEPALEEALARIAPGMAVTAHRDFSLVVGGATPAAQLGDLLATLWDPCVILHDHDSIAPTVEEQTGLMLLDLFRLPREAFVPTFTTGASASNLVALACARQWWGQALGRDLAEQGWAGLPQPVVLSGAPHSSVRKALAELGLGRTSRRLVATLPDRTAVDPAALETSLREHGAHNGDAPAIVVANAGEVSTGDFDNLRAVAASCLAHGAWLHVDAAFGIFARCAPGLAALADGLEAADSIAGDLHKLLNVPYDSGLVLLAARHRALYAAVFSAIAPYLGGGTAMPEIHPMNRRVENSSRFRALPAWVTLKAYGREGYRRFVERLAAHARLLAGWIATSHDYRLANEPVFNVVLFQGTEVDGAQIVSPARNQELLARINATGQISLTAGTHAGQPAIRIAFAKWLTDEADLDITTVALERGMVAFRSGDAA